MMTIPISALPSQTLHAVLAGQNCTINIYQKSTGVYLDLFVDSVAVVTCGICLDRANTVRYDYLGFVGGLVFADSQGVTDPDYTGFGSRYDLIYLEASDL